MPTRNDQVFIGFKCDPDFRDRVASAAGSMPLSQFIRDALIAKLKAMNIPVPANLAAAPSRLGKGGPKPKNIVNHFPDRLRAAEGGKSKARSPRKTSVRYANPERESGPRVTTDAPEYKVKTKP
ncbi:MAG: hypothetical protein P4L99_21775 [Chthoniobacter sp.]|nr:hypothetical protein [Chthoniobacter sp.]